MHTHISGQLWWSSMSLLIPCLDMMERWALIWHRHSPWLSPGMCPLQCAVLNHLVLVTCPETLDASVAWKRWIIHKESDGTVKVPAFDYDVCWKKSSKNVATYIGWNEGASKAKRLAGFNLLFWVRVDWKVITMYSLAKDLTMSTEEGTLTRAPQQKKNQCMSSARITSKSGLMTTLIIHYHRTWDKPIKHGNHTPHSL